MAPAILVDNVPAVKATTGVTPAQQLPSTTTMAKDQGHSTLLHRSLKEQPLEVVSSSGSYLTLSDDRKILDSCGGAAVAIIGHGNEEVIAATLEQMRKVSYAHSLTYTTESAERLADCVFENGAANGFDHGLRKAYFVSSGSEANDAAIKCAKQYWYEKGEKQRKYFVSRRQAYHGGTIGAMSISSYVARKVPYDGLQIPNVSHVSPAYTYQYKLPRETEEEYAARLVEEIDAEFQRLGPQNVVSFIAEPIVGATSGCNCAPKGYFKGIRKLCDTYGILLHLDEVMCGTGRTGTYFAFEQENVLPDIVTIGKGLGGGYAPISAMLINGRIVDALYAGTASLNHGHTYQAHPVACAAALAVQRIVKREGLVERAAVQGRKLEQLLRETFKDCTHVGDIRGRGLFWALEFVNDRNSKTPFSPDLKFGGKVRDATHDLGVAVYPGAGTVDGILGDHVIIAPPYTVSDEELSITVSTLKKAYDQVTASISEA